MGKLKITPQAESVVWFEQPLGTFHLEIKAKSAETAENYRKFLPLVEKFLLMGWNGDSEKVMETKNAMINGES